MSDFSTHTFEQVITVLRRIIRAHDLHSHMLVQRQGITTPQLLILRELSRVTDMTAGELARRATFGQATLTGILDRLEARGWIVRSRCDRDKRRVLVRLTVSGHEALNRAPAPLQDRFVSAFGQLPDWEQSQILASLQKVAALMEKTEPETRRTRSQDERYGDTQTTGGVHGHYQLNICPENKEVSQ